MIRVRETRERERERERESKGVHSTAKVLSESGSVTDVEDGQRSRQRRNL
jgi:hypothetical protein